MNEDRLATVRKILAKAEDPATTPEEAEAYTAKAAELVATYGIDRALLSSAEPGSDAVGSRVVVLDPPYARDKVDLLGVVAVELGCQAVQRVRYVGRGKQLSVHLFGYGADLARVEVLFTSLLLQSARSLARLRAPYGESLAAYRRSWMAGFTAAVRDRLGAAEQRARQRAEATTRDGAGPSVALVLADRAGRVDAEVAREYPRLRRSARRLLSGSGGLRGWAAGQQADLGGTRFAGGARSAIDR